MTCPLKDLGHLTAPHPHPMVMIRWCVGVKLYVSPGRTRLAKAPSAGCFLAPPLLMCTQLTGPGTCDRPPYPPRPLSPHQWGPGSGRQGEAPFTGPPSGVQPTYKEQGGECLYRGMQAPVGNLWVCVFSEM